VYCIVSKASLGKDWVAPHSHRGAPLSVAVFVNPYLIIQ
jgi:hypothetical protein